MLPNEALEIILNAMPLMGREILPLYDAQNRTIAEKIVSNRDVPLMDSASMDGYALRAIDLASLPAILKVKGIISAGSDVSALTIKSGECYRIMTGAYIPEGADTVIEWELTDNGSETVVIKALSSMGNNIRPAQDDVAAGTVLNYEGKRVSPFMMSRLASMGVFSLSVYRKPRIAVIATGNEIAATGNYIATNKLFDANSPAVIGMLRMEQADCSYMGVIEDDEQALLDILRTAANFDMIIITGGISAGDFDYMAKSANKAGIKWLFHKIEQKPGKPLAFGFMGNTPIFAVPGNPVSCMFCTYYYVVPGVRKMSGMANVTQNYIMGILAEDITRRKGRVQFDRAQVTSKDGILHIYPYKSQNSNLIGSMVDCDAFMELGSFDGTVKKGEQVKIYLFNREIL